MRALSATSLKMAAVLAWIGCSAAAMSAFGQAAYPGYGTYPGSGVYPASGYQAAGDNAVAPAEQRQEQGQPAGEASCDAPLGGLFAGLCDPNRCAPRWSFTAEAILLQRSTTRSQTLFSDKDYQAVALNSQTFNFPAEAGPKLSAICHGVWEDFDLEVTYFQVDGFTAERPISGTSNMATYGDGGPGKCFQVTDGVASYKSAFYSGEVNVRWLWFDGVTLLSGFRMGQLNEHYRADGTGANPDFPVHDSLTVNAFNHLYGYQLGADMEVYNMGGPLRINALCKAGALANYAEFNIHRMDPVPPPYTIDDSRNSTRSNHYAFLGEVGLTATYAITERLAVRASYSAVWLEGVALAPEQIGATDFSVPTAAIDTTGGVFYTGGGIGIEYRF